jgi:hypothetical protein
MKDLVLPSFAMDCRDWVVITPAQAGLPDDDAGSPLLAVLSTVVLGADSFRSASAILTVALLDSEVATRPLAGSTVAAQLLDADGFSDPLRYVLPTPDGQLALVAEFTTPDGADGEVVARIESLMASFRWA